MKNDVQSAMTSNVFAFKETSGFDSTMSIYVKRYNIKGELISEAPLSNQLTLCSLSSEEVSNFTKFGMPFTKECETSLKGLFVKQEMYMYELYLRLNNGSSIDVPVVISDFRDIQASTPNSDSTQKTSFTFMRRYFIFDNLQGVAGTTESDLENNVPVIIRYISSATINFMPFKNAGEDNGNEDSVGDGVFRKPYVYIQYSTLDLASKGGSVTCKFQVDSE